MTFILKLLIKIDFVNFVYNVYPQTCLGSCLGCSVMGDASMLRGNGYSFSNLGSLETDLKRQHQGLQTGAGLGSVLTLSQKLGAFKVYLYFLCL